MRRSQAARPLLLISKSDSGRGRGAGISPTRACVLDPTWQAPYSRAGDRKIIEWGSSLDGFAHSPRRFSHWLRRLWLLGFRAPPVPAGDPPDQPRHSGVDRPQWIPALQPAAAEICGTTVNAIRCEPAAFAGRAARSGHRDERSRERRRVDLRPRARRVEPTEFPRRQLSTCLVTRWKPRGVLYSAGRAAPGIYRAPADGSGKEELLVAGSRIPGRLTARLCCTDPRPRPASGWSRCPRRQAIANRECCPNRRLSTRRRRKSRRTGGGWPTFPMSPGRARCMRGPFPDRGSKVPISIEAGDTPRWSANGREILYFDPDKDQVMAVAIEGGAVLQPRTATCSLHPANPRLGRYA